MFNIQGSELIFLLLIALIVLGPEKLPDAVRKFGRAYGEFKKMANGFQGELRSAIDDPMKELRDTAEAMRNAVKFDVNEPVRVDAGADAASPATEVTEPAAIDPPATDTSTATPTQGLNFGGRIDLAPQGGAASAPIADTTTPGSGGLNFGRAVQRPAATPDEGAAE